MPFEKLVNCFVVVQYVDGRGQSVRTIAKLLSVQDGFATMESPTKKEQYVLNLKNVVKIDKLPAAELDPNKIR